MKNLGFTVSRILKVFHQAFKALTVRIHGVLPDLLYHIVQVKLKFVDSLTDELNLADDLALFLLVIRSIRVGFLLGFQESLRLELVDLLFVQVCSGGEVSG
jgi:hypothetical protein